MCIARRIDFFVRPFVGMHVTDKVSLWSVVISKIKEWLKLTPEMNGK